MKKIKKTNNILGHNSSETTKIYVCADDSDDDDELFID